MREWVIRQTNKQTKQSKLMLDVIYNDKEIANNAINLLNKNVSNNIYTLIELVEVVETHNYPYEMSKEEQKAYNLAILNIEEDLQKIISYDEWSAREYGNVSVDYYDTAISLYNAGYRKVKEIKYEEEIEEEAL